ncbi:hypothetical protein HYZ41_04600 [archaeon]|nr:hypothetical protein [archaeon]
MKTLLLVILTVLVMSSVGFAHVDPTPILTIAADHPQVDTAVTLTINAEDRDFRAGIVSITLKEDGKTISTKNCNEFAQCTYIVTVEHTAKGSHNYAAYVRDRNGNVRAESVFVKFKGATPIPVFVFEDKPFVEEGKSLQLGILAEDFNHNAIKNISVSGLPKGAVFENNVLKWTPNFNQSGYYTLWFSAMDIRNQTARKSMYVTVVGINRPPTAKVVDPTQTNFMLNEGSSTIFTLNITDPDTKKPSVEWMLDGKLVSTANPYTYKPDYEDAGNHVLVARVIDGPYLQRFMWNLTVNNVNREPKFNHITDKTVKEGETVKVSVKANDIDKDALIYEATQMPAGAKFDPDKGLFEWTAKPAGDYMVSFRVKDTKGYSSSTYFEIHVKPENLTLREQYDKMIHEWEKRQKTIADQRKVTTGGNQQPPSQTQNINAYRTELICNNDYLCYTLTYLIQQ